MATIDADASLAVGEGVATASTTVVYGWRTVAPMPGGRTRGAAFTHGGFLYYYAGLDLSAEVAHRTLFKYDSFLNVWTETLIGSDFLPPTPNGAGASSAMTRRYNFVFGLMGDELYVLGGYDRYRFDPQHPVAYSVNLLTNQVTRYNDAPNIVTGTTTSSAYDGKIWYLFGYSDAGTFRNRMRYWDPVTNAHVDRANDSTVVGQSLPGAAWGPDNKYHVFGGTSTAQAHRIYDPATNTWSAGPAVPTTSNNLAAYLGVATIGNFMYIVLSLHPPSWQPINLKYDVFLGTYSSISQYHTAALQGISLVPFQGALWGLGGSISTGGTASDERMVRRLTVAPMEAPASVAYGEGYASSYSEGWSAPAYGEGVTAGEPEVVPSSVWLTMHGGPVPLRGDRLLEHYADIRQDI